MTALCVGPCRPTDHGGPRQTRTGSHLCEVCGERIREDLHKIADTWDDLTDRLGQEGSRALSEKVNGSKEPGLVINDRVSDVLREATAWLWFVARVVTDEREVNGPKVQTPPALARWLASTHSPWLARHSDEQMAADFATEAHRLARACHSAAYPSGARRLEMPELRCTDHTTGEDGSRVPCTGTMYVLLLPWVSVMPDLVCELDDTHRIEPAVWARPGWRRHIDPDAAVALARRIAG